MYRDGQWRADPLSAADILAGVLSPLRGGTGVSNIGSLTVPLAVAITGGGTLALGGFTLTVPATGTAVLTTTAQSIAGVKTFTDTTSASTSLVGAVVVGNGVAATSVAIGAGNINAGGTLTLSTSTSGQILSANADTDTSHALGRARIGFAAAGSSDYAYFAHFDMFTGTNYAIAQGATGDTYFNCASGQSLNFNFANGNKLSINGTVNTFNSTNTTAFANTTDATAIGTASVVQAGGQSTAKNILAGQAIAAGVTSTATAAGTTALTNASRRTQIFTGVTTQTLQMPAANLFGAGVAVELVIINRSTGSVTASRAGADTFVGGGTTDVITTLTQRYYVSDGVSVWYSFAI